MASRGINRADKSDWGKLRISFDKLLETSGSHKKNCVFISHQKVDTSESEVIAEHLLNAGLDVYFDKFEEDLSSLVRSGNSQKVTDSILKGINESTHMLVVISKNTKQSYWVPFEVGFAYQRISLASITIKGLADYELPDYLKIKPIYRGTNTLNQYIRGIVLPITESKEFSEKFINSINLNSPINKVLDWDK